MARYRASKYEVIHGVWKGMYGSMTWIMNDLNKLEVVQNRMGKTALGAKKYVGVEAIKGEAGWKVFEERMAKGKMRY